MKAHILAAILHMLPHPSPKWHETQQQYEERVDMISGVIESVTKDYALEMAIVVTIVNESHLDPEVHAGTKLGDNGSAICLGQHHQLWRTREEWQSLAGTDPESTRRCIAATAKGLRSALMMCRNRNPGSSYPEAFVLYGTGQTCDASKSLGAAHFGRRATQWHELVGG
jgi:hypothetical protein